MDHLCSAPCQRIQLGFSSLLDDLAEEVAYAESGQQLKLIRSVFARR